MYILIVILNLRKAEKKPKQQSFDCLSILYKLSQECTALQGGGRHDSSVESACNFLSRGYGFDPRTGLGLPSDLVGVSLM